MTRKELSQIYYYNRLLEKLQRELDEMEHSGPGSPKIDGMPRAPGRKSDPTGRKGTAAADISNSIKRLQKKIEKKTKEIWKFIEELDDPYLSLIIQYRCLALCEWQEVADNIGGTATADSVKQYFHRHID